MADDFNDVDAGGLRHAASILEGYGDGQERIVAVNVLDILKNDHRQIFELFDRLERTLDPATGQSRADRFDELATAIRQHHLKLRKVLYPASETHSELRDLISNQANVDRRTDELLENIERNQPPEQGWSGRLGETRRLWLDHVERSEIPYHSDQRFP